MQAKECIIPLRKSLISSLPLLSGQFAASFFIEEVVRQGESNPAREPNHPFIRLLMLVKPIGFYPLRKTGNRNPSGANPRKQFP